MQLKSAEKGFDWPPRGWGWSFRADRTACSREDHPAAARAAAIRINAVSRLLPSRTGFSFASIFRISHK
jgi:hypothetical protein